MCGSALKNISPKLLIAEVKRFWILDWLHTLEVRHNHNQLKYANLKFSVTFPCLQQGLEFIFH
ncbi:hypothetical protein FDUTEX481_09069 [Tolypothrix sp. PCC 7601]|nr:hypothetical protein FDUTEX481_09069 [Tolypothrix sp. PCC 7601]